MDSPLTQQTRPDVFEPKVVGLYRRIFREGEDEDKDDAFWSTLFLLKPDPSSLQNILENTDAGFLLQLQVYIVPISDCLPSSQLNRFASINLNNCYSMP